MKRIVAVRAVLLDWFLQIQHMLLYIIVGKMIMALGCDWLRQLRSCNRPIKKMKHKSPFMFFDCFICIEVCINIIHDN